MVAIINLAGGSDERERIQALEKAVAEARRVQRQDYAVEQAVSALQQSVRRVEQAVSTVEQAVSTVEQAVRVQTGVTGGLHDSMLSYQSSSLSLFDMLYGAVVAESDQKDAAIEEIRLRLDRLENPPAA